MFPGADYRAPSMATDILMRRNDGYCGRRVRTFSGWLLSATDYGGAIKIELDNELISPARWVGAVDNRAGTPLRRERFKIRRD